MTSPTTSQTPPRTAVTTASVSPAASTAPENLGTPVQSSTDRAAGRRSLRALAEIDAAATAGAGVLLTGSGLHDNLVDAAAKALWLDGFLDSYASGRGVGMVVYQLGAPAQSRATLPLGRATAIRPVDAGAHPSDAITSLLQDLRHAAEPTLFVIDYLDLVLPRGTDPRDLLLGVLIQRLQALSSDRQWRDLGHQLILVDRGGGIIERLADQPGYRTVRLDAPDVAETQVYIERKTVAVSTPRLHLAPSLPVELASRLTGGLLLRNLAEAAALSSREQPVDALTLSALKGEAIRQQSGGTLELLDEAVDFQRDVTGLPAVRLHLQQAQSIGSATVRVLLAGPPGTGKTYSAQAIARLLGVPLVSFGRILGELLGQAEHNMEVALGVLRAMAPCALFIDEADQGPLGTRRSTGATSNEAYQALRAKLFTFLSDPGDTSGISVIATTNVPTAAHLDSAALDRFDVLPVLCPTGPELVDVVVIQARRAGVGLGEGVAQALLDYSGAKRVLSARSATALTKQAQIVARGRGSSIVEGDDMRTALGQRFRDDWTRDVEYSTLVSIAAARTTTALPWVAAAQLGERYDPPAYLEPFLRDDDSVDIDRVHARAQDLERAGAYRA